MTKQETLMAHAIWHTRVPVYDKQEIATRLAEVLEIKDAEEFVRTASDPGFGPGGPAESGSDVLNEAAEARAEKSKEAKPKEATEGSGPVLSPKSKERQ